MAYISDYYKAVSQGAGTLSLELASAAPLLKGRMETGRCAGAIEAAFEENELFTPYMVKNALNEIFSMMADSHLLADMVTGYAAELAGGSRCSNVQNSRDEAPPCALVIMAGNIPLVGFHDFLCTLLCGYDAVVKLSSKDSHLLPWLYGELEDLCPSVKGRVTFIKSREELSGIKKSDIKAVLATGSSAAVESIWREFAGVPVLSRGSRFSFAVLQGNEADDEIDALCSDMFLYYGLGCRSVSNIMVPVGYDFTRVIERAGRYKDILSGKRWDNCYKRSRAVAVMDGICVADGGFFVLVEKGQPWVEMSEIGVWYYNNMCEVEQFEEKFRGNIQKKYLTFGMAQSPAACEFADNKNSIFFLLHI